MTRKADHRKGVRGPLRAAPLRCIVFPYPEDRFGSCVDGAPASSAELAWRRLRSSAVMCLACLVQPFSRLLAPMWFARRVLIRPSGSTPVTQQKVLPPRRPTDRHHAISTSATRDALRRVPLALALQSCAAAAAITPSPSLLSGQPRTPALDMGGRDARSRRRRRGP